VAGVCVVITSRHDCSSLLVLRLTWIVLFVIVGTNKQLMAPASTAKGQRERTRRRGNGGRSRGQVALVNNGSSGNFVTTTCCPGVHSAQRFETVVCSSYSATCVAHATFL